MLQGCLYKRNGYYYLMVAEGGTAYDHVVTVARSQDLWSGYEPDPASPMLTSRNSPECPFQRAGHGCLVEPPAGEAYMAYLCSRPVKVEADGRTKRYSILGRETSIIPVEWTDEGWLRVKGGGSLPLVEVPAPALPSHPSDEHLGSFTGAFCGLAAVDLSGKRKPADFRSFTYSILSDE